MVTEPITIVLDPNSELAHALAEAGGRSLRLISDGARFRVSREVDDPEAGYDPAALRDAIRAAAGTITPEEGERRKAAIYRGREEGTRPIDRP